MFDDLADLYQEVILDHSKSPRNFHKLEAANRTAQGHNPLCGDNVTLYLLMDGDLVKDISFLGSGCAISKASASILTTALKGKTKAEVKSLFDKVHNLVTTGKVNGDDLGVGGCLVTTLDRARDNPLTKGARSHENERMTTSLASFQLEVRQVTPRGFSLYSK